MQDTKPPMPIPAVQYSTFIWDLALGVHGKFLHYLYKTKWNVLYEMSNKITSLVKKKQQFTKLVDGQNKSNYLDRFFKVQNSVQNSISSSESTFNL